MSDLGSFDYSTIKEIPEVMLRLEMLEQRLDTLTNGEPRRMLEIGLGAGDTTLMLARRFRDVTCLDADETNSNLVLSRIQAAGISHVKFIRGMVEDAALSPDGYDHIFLLNLLEHVKDPVAVLGRLAVHLRPKGRIHITVPLANSLHRWLGVEMGMIAHVEDLAASDHEFGHHRVYVPALLRRHVQESGLKIALEKPFYVKPLPTSVLNPLNIELHRALFNLAERFPEFASYQYVEAER